MSQEKSNQPPLSDKEKAKSVHQDSTKPMPSYSASEAGGPLSEIDEGPRPAPVDEIQQALFEAAQADLPTEVEFTELSPRLPDLDSGPPPGPVDEVQEAILKAAQAGQPTHVDFDTLPAPTVPDEPEAPKKVIRFNKPKAPAPKLTIGPDTEPEPILELSEPDPVPAISDFWFLLVLFISFRLLTLFLLRPGGFIRDWSEFDTYFGIASLSDYALYPFLDFWLEWPPLGPWLAVGAYKLALLLPPWPDDPRLWFILILGSVFVLFEIGNFVLIYQLARRLFQSSITVYRVLWFYAGLFPPIYAMLGFFDGVTLFFILLALQLMLEDRRFLSAVVIGLGFMVKIIPIVMLPVALRRLWYHYRGNNREASIEGGLYGVVFALTVLALLAPFIIIPALSNGPQWWWTSARSIAGRSSWETVWAVAEGYYGFGQVDGDRLEPALGLADFAIHDGWPPGVWFLITLLFIGIYGYIFTRPADYSRPRNLVAFAGLTLTIFMLYSKGYSPQFLVYLLPFILLLMPDGRGLTYALILTGLNVLEQPVYFVLLPDQAWLLTFIVIARFIMWLVLAVEFALILWPAEERLAILGQARERAPLVLGALAGLALLILTPMTILAYSNNQLDNSSVGAFAGFMEIQAENQPDKPRLLLSDQAVYRQLYPHLARLVDLQMADGANRFEGAASVSDLIQGLDRVWILPAGPQQNALRNAVSARGQELAAYDFEGLGTASLYTFRPNPIPLIAPARFTGGVELLGHQLDVEAGTIELTLYWRALNPQAQGLTVFTQLLNADGEQVAGHDSVPREGAAPVTSWPAGAVQADTHRIEIPRNLPPGEYNVIAGLYNEFKERVRTIDPNGTNYPDQAVPLETLSLP
jgi:hypothetical protein